ncbi:hypothetical protein JJB99_01890 [Bradyrhizobium diazoefficiens]|nr:hypothetical protein JJB99_01890 [Bradyrhizobium diazoefficiens]
MDSAIYEAYKATNGANPDSSAFEDAFLASLIEQAPLEAVTDYLDRDTAATLARALNNRVARSSRMNGRARPSEVELQHEPWVRLQGPDQDPELDAILFGDTSLSNAV